MKNQNSLLHKSIVWLGQPVIPWFVLVTTVIFCMITAQYMAGVTAGILSVLLHLVAQHISENFELEEIVFASRKNVTNKIENCVCGNAPSVFYCNKADHFFVRCEHCSRQGLPGYDVDGAISRWEEVTGIIGGGGASE